MSGKSHADQATSSEERDAFWMEKQRSRERHKTLGLAVFAVLILVLLFLLFGKTIPWAAR